MSDWVLFIHLPLTLNVLVLMGFYFFNINFLVFLSPPRLFLLNLFSIFLWLNILILNILIFRDLLILFNFVSFIWVDLFYINIFFFITPSRLMLISLFGSYLFYIISSFIILAFLFILINFTFKFFANVINRQALHFIIIFL